MATNPQYGGTTYQSIVIALVAGGILSTGVISIIWKRRQARRWAEMRRRLPVGGDAARDSAGWGGGLRGGGLGKEPGIWDVVFGEKERISDGGKGEVVDGDGEKREESEAEDLDGEMGTGWRPTSLSLTSPSSSAATGSKSPSTAPIPSSPHSAEITVLIAMPDPMNASAGPSTPRRSTQPYDPPDYSPIYHYPLSSPSPSDPNDDDDRPLPLLEIGSTSIPVIPSPRTGLKGQPLPDRIEDIIKAAAAQREAASGGRRNRSRSTAWDGVMPSPALQDLYGAPGQAAQSTEPARDPMTAASAAGRFAMLRNGALAGFGSPGGRRA